MVYSTIMIRLGIYLITSWENLLIIVLGKNVMPKIKNLEKMVFFKLDLYQTYKKYVYKFKASLIFLNFLNFHIFLDTS